MLLSENSLTPTQDTSIKRLIEHDRTLLVAPTGEGKTIICLTAIKELTADGRVERFIVACPAKVVPVWYKEAKKWEHTLGIHIMSLDQGPKERLAELHKFKRVNNPAPVVFVVSLNSLDWLLQQPHGCEGIIIDELSKAAGKQAKKLNSKKWAGMLKWRVGMTATPVSQDFEKLYTMCKIIDGGEALGTRKDAYLNKYFYSDYMGYNWTLRDGASSEIMEQVKPLIHIIADIKNKKLPPIRYHKIEFDMPAETRVVYNKMKKDMLVGDVEAANEAVKSGKLRQLASGFLYDEEEVEVFDQTRGAQATYWRLCSGLKVVVFYEYKHQYEVLMDAIPGSITDVKEFIESNKHETLLAQVNSLSHGIDGLQDVCSDVLFYHPMWSRDATEQAVGRVWRTGQKHEVNVTTLVCRNTLDDLVLDRVEDRGEFMKLFTKHLKGN
jgi:superfamily II DNA or RNA helicase